MTNKRLDCPKCGGQNTYTESVEDGYKVWNCYRDSCNNKGKRFIGVRSNKCNPLTVTNWQPDREYIEPRLLDYRSVPSAHKFIDKYHCEIDLNEVRYKYDTKQDRLVFIYRDLVLGRALGYTRRKWHKYTKVDTPFMATKNDRKKVLVLVEDCVSAANCARLYDSMALLGTNFKLNYLTYIMDYDNIIVALDEDATNAAIKIQRQLCLLKPTKVMRIEKDIKHWSFIDLEHRIKEYINDE